MPTDPRDTPAHTERCGHDEQHRSSREHGTWPDDGRCHCGCCHCFDRNAAPAAGFDCEFCGLDASRCECEADPDPELCAGCGHDCYTHGANGICLRDDCPCFWYRPPAPVVVSGTTAADQEARVKVVVKPITLSALADELDSFSRAYDRNAAPGERLPSLLREASVAVAALAARPVPAAQDEGCEHRWAGNGSGWTCSKCGLRRATPEFVPAAASPPVAAAQDERSLTPGETEVVVGALDNALRAWLGDPSVHPDYLSVARTARAKLIAAAASPPVADTEALAARATALLAALPHGPWTVQRLGNVQRITNGAAVLIAECSENPAYKDFADIVDAPTTAEGIASMPTLIANLVAALAAARPGGTE